MQRTNFQIDWDTKKFKLKVNSSTLTGTSAKRLDSPSTSIEETSLTAQARLQQAPQKKALTWIVDEANPGSS